MINEPATAAPSGLSAGAFSSLFQAVNGLRNRPAIVALLGCTFAGVLLAALLLTMAGTLGMVATLLAMLVWVVAIGTGVNAAGLLQMDRAEDLGTGQRSIVDALVQGLMCIPKLIVMALAFFAVEVAVFVVIALLMLVCKVPFLGPLLFVVVFPLSVVVAGLTVVGVFICMVLSLPAIWQGASISRALAQTMAIVRSRLIEAVLLLSVIGLLAMVVGFIVFGVLGAGLLPTLGLAASIVGFGGLGGFGDLGSLMAMTQGAGGGHAIAGAIGSLLLWAVAGSLVGQVYLRGLALVYLRLTEGLDVGAAEAAMRAKLDAARQRASELGDKARSVGQREAPTPLPAGASMAAPASTSTASSAASAIGTASAVTAAAAYTAPAPAPYNPPPAYSAPPAFSAAPPARHDSQADIDLSFDDSPTAPATPSYAAPPAWAPPPVVQPVAAPPPSPVLTTCPQCLSPVTPDDVFCGVCGYRLK